MLKKLEDGSSSQCTTATLASKNGGTPQYTSLDLVSGLRL